METSFWDVHFWDIPVLIGLTFFPRITLLFIGGPLNVISWFGVFHWFGWLVAPHLLVAIVATMTYMFTNPFLVAFSWMLAIAGCLGEKKVVQHKIHNYMSDDE